jgi:uncharacterized protein YozE (UPF0346 family)
VINENNHFPNKNGVFHHICTYFELHHELYRTRGGS